MKNLFFGLFYSFLVILVVGCGGGGEKSSTTLSEIPPLDEYKMIDSSVSDEIKSQLQIKAISENENGEAVTTGALSDVIAQKDRTYTDYAGNQVTTKDIVFRSFNFSRWKGKLNEETTLLSRVFMGTDFPKLSDAKKQAAVDKVINATFYKEAILNQLLYIENPILFESVYFRVISSLEDLILDDVTIKTNRSVFSNNNTSNKQSRHKTSTGNLGGGLTLSFDSAFNKFLFKNYFSLYYGIRSYDINNPNNSYSLSDTFSDNLINPVSGGLLGGGIAALSQWLNLSAYIKTPADDPKFGNDFDGDLYQNEKTLKPNIDKTYEIYKYQGLSDISTIYNIFHIAEISLSGIISKKWNKKPDALREKYENIEKNVFKYTDYLLSTIQVSVVMFEYLERSLGTDYSYKVEDYINKIRDILEILRGLFNSRYEEYFKDNSNKYTTNESKLKKAIEVLGLGYNTLENKTLKNALKDKNIFTKKQKMEIFILGYLKKYIKYVPTVFKEMQDDEFFKKYSFISKSDYGYIAAMGYVADNSTTVDKLLKSAYRKKKLNIKTYLIDYSKFLARLNKKYSIKTWFKDTITDSLKKLKDLAKVLDLIRNTSRSVANVNDLFSISSLKTVLSLLKDVFLDGFDTNHLAALIAKKLAGSYAKLALAVNEGTSFAYGSLFLPNKVYFSVETDNEGRATLKLPEYAPLGLISDVGIEEDLDKSDLNNWFKKYVYRGSKGLLTVEGSFHRPLYNFYFMVGGNPDDLFRQSFPNDTFMSISYKVRRSTMDTKGFFDDDLDNENNTFSSDISPNTLVGKWSSGDYGYYFDIWEAYRKQENLTTKNVTFKNKTRGIYKAWLDYKTYYPSKYENQDSPGKSNQIYLYNVANSDTLKNNIEIERIGDSIRIQNYGDFEICYAVFYEKDNSSNFRDDKYYFGDICIAKKRGMTISASQMQKYKDGSDFNDVKFIFFDGIAETFFKEEGYWNIRYYQWFKKSGGLSNMTYDVELDDLDIRVDSDQDGISDTMEMAIGTKPDEKDSDGDKIDDGWEIQHGLDPNDKYDASKIFPSIFNDSQKTYLDVYRESEGIYVYVEQSTISGKVLSVSGRALDGINIKFEYKSNNETLIKRELTDVNGYYSISIDKDDFDNFKDGSKLVITAFADGYNPKVEEITKTNQQNYNIDFTLEPIKENEIILEIEPKLHHLGDGHYTGSANSDFQKAGAEGTSFEKVFTIDSEKFDKYQRAEITFEAKGMQNYGNKLFLNNTSHSLNNSPYDGSYATQKIQIKKSEYIKGENKLTIISGKDYNDYDDFEFINIKITFLDPVTSLPKPSINDSTYVVGNDELQVTIFYDANNGKAIDYVYWKLTSPFGKVYDLLVDTDRNLMSGSKTMTVSYNNTGFYDVDGIYKLESYVINEDGIKSDIYRTDLYIAKPDNNIHNISNLRVDSITNHSARISWDGDLNVKTWVYVHEPYNITGAKLDTQNGTYTYSTLASGTTFTVYIEDNYGNILSKVFTTLP